MFCSLVGGHKVPEQPYEGQVWLCPPDGADAGPLHQISMGLVLIFLHNEWGAINERNIETSLRTYRANSICRQLGYSQAVPDSTLTVEGASARYTYDTCQSLVKPGHSVLSLNLLCNTYHVGYCMSVVHL